jgi:1-deoxy-D-xylulose-5-phosphate reductoisomerase
MEAARVRGTAPALLNAANEESVSAFLAGRLRFNRIAEISADVMAQIPCEPAGSLAIIIEADSRARSLANSLINNG